MATTESVKMLTNGARSAPAHVMSKNSEVADAYDALFGALRLARPLAAGNLILITSTEPDEGKTTVASGLANTGSLAGQSILLIDGDLRRSSLTSLVGSADTEGLIEVLLGEVDPADVIHPITASTDAPQAGAVMFMSAGRKSPLFLGAVDWPEARTAFRSIAQKFDLVLLDSPPILAANDALLFASIVDAIILVVGTGNANLDRIQRAKEQLVATGTPILGAVLNRFEPKVHGPSNQPYRGYHRPSRT